VNQVTPYEQLVAQEMEHLPLPDSMESIWADIESQLDIDLPSGDGKNPPLRKPAPRRGSGWTSSWRLFVIAGSIITILLITQIRKRNHLPDRQQPVTPPEKTIIPDTAVHRDGSPGNEQHTKPLIKKPVVKDTVSVVPPDTSLLIPSPIFGPPVSQPVNPPIVIPGKTVIAPPPTSKDSVKAPGKKTRGILNINDSDYKIIPKNKDSIKRGP
jgi:hypothetical protein